MSFKRALSAALAAAGAWAVLKGTAGAQNTASQGEPRIIKVTQPNRTGTNARSALFGGILDAIFDGNDMPIFGGGGGDPRVGGVVATAPQSLASRSNSGSIGQRLLGDVMRDFGLTRTQAAGLVGNLDHESEGFSDLTEDNPIVAGSRGGYGYAQWTGPRRREFEAWTQARGLNPSSYDANYGFLKYELSSTWEKRVIPKLRNAQTLEDATQIVQDVYLRPGIPHYNSRLSAAKNYA